VLKHIGAIAQAEGVEAYLADATVFLEFFGIITIAWQWLLQAVHAESLGATARKKADRRFYTGKRRACDYFFKYELPKIHAISKTLLDPNRPTLAVTADQF
jgi:butyryl-CoA dehydrogenase